MHDTRRRPRGNPVGSDEPLVKLNLPMWQVYVALFLIATVLTAFKVYERRTIAPRQPIVWQPLPGGNLQQQRRTGRNILIWVRGDNQTGMQRVRDLAELPDVRAAVYLNRFLTFEVQAAERFAKTDPTLAATLQPIAAGGLAVWLASESQPVCLDSIAVDSVALLKVLDRSD